MNPYPGTGGIAFGGQAQCSMVYPPAGGIVTGPPSVLATMFANCASWQARTAPDSPMTHIHIIGAFAEGDVEGLSRPFIVIQVPLESLNLRLETGDFNRGKMIVWIQDALPSWAFYNSHSSAFNYFGNFLEQLVIDLKAQNGGGQLFVRDVTYLKEPVRANLDRVDDWWECALLVSFGPD